MKIVEKGKKIAAHLLEASAGDIAFEDGMFGVAGTDRRVTLARGRARRLRPTNYPAEPGARPAGHRGLRSAELRLEQRRPCLRGRGRSATPGIDLVGYWGVDDIGTVINPMIVEGQIHGGIAQGLGQAMREHCVYDRRRPAAVRLVHGLRDAARDDMPAFVSELDESQPCTHNPLGAKGCGEAGSIGAPTAIVGAVLDALRPSASPISKCR